MGNQCPNGFSAASVLPEVGNLQHLGHSNPVHVYDWATVVGVYMHYVERSSHALKGRCNSTSQRWPPSQLIQLMKLNYYDSKSTKYQLGHSLEHSVLVPFNVHLEKQVAIDLL